MTENKRFTHKMNRLGMQFICYDDKEILMGTFADADGVAHIVEILNELSTKCSQLEKENKGIQDKVWRLLEFLEVEYGIDKRKVIDWWNGDVEI